MGGIFGVVSKTDCVMDLFFGVDYHSHLGTYALPTVGRINNKKELVNQVVGKSGAKEVHVRPACLPLVFGCKFLNFSRSTSELDLITRRVILEREEGVYLLLEWKRVI